MGILPLEFMEGNSVATLGITGEETFKIMDLNKIKPSGILTMDIKQSDGILKSFPLKVRIDTGLELEYWKAGGILNYVLLDFMQ
jgi:aconitate hydratase